MKVLVLTLNAWNITNSTGNTITNLFSKFNENDEVANIYCRDEAIDNPICDNYFKITEKDIIHHPFSQRYCGSVIEAKSNAKQSSSTNISRGSYLRKHRYTALLLLRELIWSRQPYGNKNIKQFVLDFSPDIIYMHGHDNLYMHRIMEFCQKISGAKVVMYWGDDMYGRKRKSPLGYLYESILRRRFRKSINQASLLFGGSLKLCDEYSALFGKKFIPFFKECRQVGFDENKQIGNPINIVYAGNLLFGREQMMVKLAQSIKSVNSRMSSPHYLLKIYSNTIPSADSMLFLDDKENCCYMGCKPYSEVCKVMDDSELVLFLESFEKKSILSTRLSFSTKIIDCLQSTAGILAIGPADIASMEYLIRNHLGYAITNPDDIEAELEYLSKHTDIIQTANRHKVEFAMANHINTSAKALDEIRKLI